MPVDILNCSQLYSQPGIQRDGTPYDGALFIAGQWTRFYKGKPRKIGGYRALDYGTLNPIRSLLDVPNGPIVDIYIGRSDSLTYVQLPQDNASAVTVVNEIDRTPIGYIPDSNNFWSTAVYTATTAMTAYEKGAIVALVSPNVSDINNQRLPNDTTSNLYYGSLTDNAPFVEVVDKSDPDNITPVQATGGVVFVAPLLIVYGNNGQIFWNNPNVEDPLNTWSTGTGSDAVKNSATVANTKIVNAFPVIGSQSPTVLFWSLNQLVRATYVPITDQSGVTTYSFSNAPIDKISILAANSVVSYQQTFFWIGTDNFYMYDGVVRVIPNTTNLQWFFDNVNLSQRNKICSIVIPQYGEIWWFFPLGDSLENNHAIIYNVNGQYWYDTAISRSAALQANLYPKPLMADNVPTQINTRIGPVSGCILWEHEVGYDKVINSQNYPIAASYSHHIIDICSQESGQNALIRTRRFDPDIKMTGEMSISVTNLMYPNDLNNGRALVQGPYKFNNQTQYIDFDVQGRLIYLSFESNTVGGFFQGGKSLYEWNVGDKQT